MRDEIAIVGTGLLADLVCQCLSDEYSIIRCRSSESGIPQTVKMGIRVEEEYRTLACSDAEKWMRKTGIPWLSGTVRFDEGWVGPLVRPETAGCSQCAETRMTTAHHNPDKSLEIQLTLMKQGVVKRDRSVSRHGLVQMSGLMAGEVRRILRGLPARTDRHVYLLDLKTMSGSLRSFLPDPLCEICGGLPEDSREAALLTLKPSLKLNSETYRCTPIDKLSDALEKDYRDDRTGLMNEVLTDRTSPFCDVMVRVPLLSGHELAAGRSHSYRHSGSLALLEGLERYSGTMPRGKRTMVYDCYLNLADRALNPVSTGLYSPEQHALPDFPFDPFDPEAEMNWVWGYSFLQERPLLVPEQLAYYSSGFGGSFVVEGSNGCALGGSLEEAIFYGIMEVVERDAFLLTWYARLPAPRLDPASANDPELNLMVNRLKAVAGFDLHLYNITMENGIPGIWALAKNAKKEGANLICAAGAHLDPVRAAKSAIFELAAHAGYLDRLAQAHREDYEQMLADPYQVREMPDHALLYTVPEAEERLRFLLDPDRPLRRFADEFKPRESNPDLTEDLKGLIREFRRLKLDVIVVEQTTAELREIGLHCVKAIIPGMLPMTFGHHLRRTQGLDRVLQVPMELGFARQPLSYDDLNPHPHPFL